MIRGDSPPAGLAGMAKEHTTRRVGFLGGALVPFQESYANQVRVLADALDASVLTCGPVAGRWKPVVKSGRYLVVRASDQRISFGSGVLLYGVLKLWERYQDVVFLAAGLESRFLRFADLTKIVPIVNSLPEDVLCRTRRPLKELVETCPAVVAQGRRIHEALIAMGFPETRVHLIHPIVDVERLKAVAPPSVDTFRLLFASAPTVERQDENNFVSKGVSMLLEATARARQRFPLELHLVWRGKHRQDLEDAIARLGLGREVRIYDGEVANMADLYAGVHATVIPYADNWRSPALPLSAVESLSCGRPVISTNVSEIGEMLEGHGCGCACEPTAAGVEEAIARCMAGYRDYQRRSREAAVKLFSSEIEQFRVLSARLAGSNGRQT